MEQHQTQAPQAPPVEELAPVVKKRVYHPPESISFGSLFVRTKGSGGDYSDECTSGKMPGDDEDA